MQLIAGRTAQEYNRRKDPQGEERAWQQSDALRRRWMFDVMGGLKPVAIPARAFRKKRRLRSPTAQSISSSAIPTKIGGSSPPTA